jgi:hypothetical protein
MLFGALTFFGLVCAFRHTFVFLHYVFYQVWWLGVFLTIFTLAIVASFPHITKHFPQFYRDTLQLCITFYLFLDFLMNIKTKACAPVENWVCSYVQVAKWVGQKWSEGLCTITYGRLCSVKLS